MITTYHDIMYSILHFIVQVKLSIISIAQSLSIICLNSITFPVIFGKINPNVHISIFYASTLFIFLNSYFLKSIFCFFYLIFFA